MTLTLVTGKDPALLAAAARRIVDEILGDADRTLAVDDLLVDETGPGALATAAATPPFLTERRVVIGRGLERLDAAATAALVAGLADRLPTTDVVLVFWESGDAGRTKRVPKTLADAAKAAGARTVGADAPSGKTRAAWVDEQAALAGVKLDAAAKALVSDRLGDDLGRLPGLLTVLASAHGPGARLGPDEVEPFLGDAGEVPPWDLTDAIDKGDTVAALDALQRLSGPGGRHPLALLSTLHTHYERMLRLDGSEVTNEQQAAALLGMKGSTFPAKKALTQARRLGSSGLLRAIVLLSEADLDLRGRRDWPEALVMEVLVARLARLAPARSASSGSRRSG